jgi:hypothetical protein
MAKYTVVGPPRKKEDKPKPKPTKKKTKESKGD